MRIARFRKKVFAHYQIYGRATLPWRVDYEPWGVLLSEFMLQQTQIERVIPYWLRWRELWRTPQALASAPLADALREWSGLGYNRRCRALWDCARQLDENFGGAVPDTPEELITLPGIGAYTSGAIACFAYNYPAVFIETNIRAALLHDFFCGKTGVTDAELIPVLKKALPRKEPRLWYWALMDYGAALKKTQTNPNRASAHYTRQSAFEGSFRQRRSAVLRVVLAQGSATAAEIIRHTGFGVSEVERIAASLEKDRLISVSKGSFCV